MNKKSHLLITSRLVEDIPEKCRSWFLFGSILPDLLFHTYLKGHTWDGAFEKISKMMHDLGRWGKENRYTYLMLGYVLHYVEDFYTMAHNPIFKKNLKRHIQYEKELEKYLLDNWEALGRKLELVPSMPALVDYLKKSHDEYLKKAGDFQTDIRYIQEAAQTVSSCLLRIMKANCTKWEQAEGIFLDVLSHYREVG